MIAFHSVSKRYSKELLNRKNRPALSEVTFSLEKGDTLGLIGANGAGKSTSIRLVMDFIRPDKGSIQILGKSPADARVRFHIGYLPETASFPVNLKLPDLIRFTAAACGISTVMRDERSKNLLQELDLWDARDKRLRNYSKGMQQRANFVLALLNDPELLILDEPMSGLDPIGRGKILNLIQRLKSDGKTILFCSHILSDVDRLVDQLLVLHQGKMLYSGSPKDFVEQELASNVEEAFLKRIERTNRAEV